MGTCDFVAGWAGGALGLVTGHPFDTVKVNQQNLGIGMTKCAKDLFINHGIRGYFRGMAFPLVAASAINSVYFGIYRVSLEHMMELRQEPNLFYFKESQVEETNSTVRRHSYTETFVAGCIGGFGQLFLTCPVEVVKIKLQTNQPLPTTLSMKGVAAYRGPMDVILHTIKSQGLRGLYQGMGITFFRDVPSSGIYWLGYAVLSDSMQKLNILKDEGETPNSLRVLMAGGLAGTFSWWSIIPLDVIKSRIQADNPINPRYKGWLDCTQQIYRKHGIKGLFRGLLPLSIRAFPVNAVTFLGYEWVNTLCCSVSC